MTANIYTRYNSTPQYLISGTLLIKDNNSTGGLSSQIGDISGNRNLGNEMVILRSKNLMHRVISELSLHTSYFFEGRFKDIEVFQDDLPVSLIISSIDSSAYGKSFKLNIKEDNTFNLIEVDDDNQEIISKYRFGQEIVKPYATFTVTGSPNTKVTKDIIVRFQNFRKLASKYSKNLWVELETKDANVLRLSLTDAVPQRGVLILNKLVDVYNKENMEDRNQVEVNSIKFLDERIAFLSEEISDVEKHVEQYKKQNDLTDVNSNAQLYLRTASEYNRELASFDLQLEIINSLEEYLQQEELRLVPSSLNISDGTLNGLISKFNELQLDRQRMLRTIQPSSSLIQNIDDQLANLRINIKENLGNIKKSLLITRDNLKSNSAQFQSKIRQVPTIDRELQEINRQQTIKQSIYLFLLQRREEAGLALASIEPKSRVIDAPSANNTPFNTGSSSTYLASILLGFLIPFSFIYLKNMLNDKITEKEDVEKSTGVPILGEITHSDITDPLQVTEGNLSPIAESFRLIRANLHFATIGKENKVILITSCRSGEGKTFFSTNLGASLAISGKKVILLEFDLRLPKLISNLNYKNKIGITNYLISNDIDLESIIIPISAIPGLSAIGAGTLPPNPAEIMMSTKVGQMIKDLRKKFDYIIIDTSPVGQVADTFNISSYADSSLYIIRYNYSRKLDLDIIEEVHQSHKLKNPMIVLNDSTNKRSKYGYEYGTKPKAKVKIFQNIFGL
ncbi:polysaccharide biosynthesis tyrosine autokinase [Litoribacter ruber]|uniref:GumC family protein n=1 Tax=Litoribacter ruber TaxID=702568 RepID=UPI001BDB53B8|nr:tyrosine-protein kinase family protein [Litoribacter ruber]MBT0812306.1 polysaccharide biosynthesis tyrosine autokinase [Litoribacter ruber]